MKKNTLTLISNAKENFDDYPVFSGSYKAFHAPETVGEIPEATCRDMVIASLTGEMTDDTGEEDHAMNNDFTNAITKREYVYPNPLQNVDDPDREFAEGYFNGKWISFPRTFSDHRFTDDEVTALLNGEMITVSYHSRYYDNPKVAIGHLQDVTRYPGVRRYYRFVPTFNEHFRL